MMGSGDAEVRSRICSLLDDMVLEANAPQVQGLTLIDHAQSEAVAEP